MKAKRTEIASQNSGLATTEITKKVAEAWNALDAAGTTIELLSVPIVYTITSDLVC